MDIGGGGEASHSGNVCAPYQEDQAVFQEGELSYYYGDAKSHIA